MRTIGQMRILGLALLLAACCPCGAAPRPDDSLEAVIAKMQKLADDSGVTQIGWRIFSKTGARYYMQAQGLEQLGRFRKGEGVRSMTTTLGCALATDESRTPGPNHYVVAYLPDEIVVAPIMLLIESSNTQASFPFLQFRAKKGEPGYDEVDPMLAPAALNNLEFINEPIVPFQLAPKLMFSHEPNLRLAGRREFAANGKKHDCHVIESTRDGSKGRGRIPEAWSNIESEKRLYFVNAGTLLIEGMEIDLVRRHSGLAGGIKHDHWVTEVATRHHEKLPKLPLPEDLVMRPLMTGGIRVNVGSHAAATHRTIELQNDCFD